MERTLTRLARFLERLLAVPVNQRGGALAEGKLPSLRSFVPRAVLVALSGSVLLYALARGALQLLGLHHEELERPLPELTVVEVMGSVIFAPVVETALLALTIALTRGLLSRDMTCVAVFNGALWGCLHGLQAPLWFFGTVWSFTVFAFAYQVFRTHSRQGALAAALLPHIGINAVVMAMLMFLD